MIVPIEESFTVDGCEGVGGKQDSIVICAPDTPINELIVLIPGDIQNHSRLMRGMLGANFVANYSYEDIASRLRQRIGGERSAVAVVCAPRHSGSLALFEHMLNVGTTTSHFQLILSSALTKASASHRLSIDKGFTPENIPLAILAFSKGSHVLNGILSEIGSFISHSSVIQDWECDDKGGRWNLPPYEPSLRIKHESVSGCLLENYSNHIENFLSRVISFHFVDAHRFPTNQVVVDAFAQEFLKRKISIHIHGTPRQLLDRSRKWIAVEHDLFLALLQQHIKHGLVVKDLKYSWDKSPSLEAHFSVLDLLEI